MNYDTTDNILWPYDDEDDQDYGDKFDLEYSQNKLDNHENKEDHQTT